MTIAPDGIDALTFDVFGTVVDWRSGVMRAAAGLQPLRSTDLGGFADAWRGLYQPLMTEVREGRRPWVVLDTLHREGLLQVLERLGIRGLTDAEIDELVLAWHRLDPWPDAVVGLARLKRRYILATLSNGNVRLLVDMAKRSGLPWDAVLGAETARAYKPQPAAYLNTAAHLGVPPSRCLMVAAHHSDLAAARQTGFRTCYVWRRQEWGGAVADDLPADHGHDLVVEDFEELATRLGCS